MFTILDRQMVFSYIKAYAFCLMSLMGLFIVIDLFINLEDFMAGRKDFASLARFISVYYGYKSFQIFDRLCESVVLLAGMFTVAWMQRNNELLPLLSAGVSTRRVVQPVLLCAFAMMGLVVANQEYGLPNIDVWMLENRRNTEGVKESDVKGTWDLNGVFVDGRSAVKKEKLVKQFVAVIPKELGQGSMRMLQAPEAQYIPRTEGDQRSGGWLLKNAHPASLPNWVESSDDVLTPLGDGAYFLRTVDVDLDTLLRVKNWFLYLPTSRLLKELDRPNNQQLLLSNLAVAFHTRMTRPVVGIILVLMGLSVILRDQNRNIFISAGLCLILCVVFFIAIFTCQYLAKEQVKILSPALSAWLPVLVFGPIACVMYSEVHT
ncbi:MAG: LptF/LptG family permease [Planctomycetes bacterium]|nr:LptF/LptG family permease [Planctomycetota bacterium]